MRCAPASTPPRRLAVVPARDDRLVDDLRVAVERRVARGVELGVEVAPLVARGHGQLPRGSLRPHWVVARVEVRDVATVYVEPVERAADPACRALEVPRR